MKHTLSLLLMLSIGSLIGCGADTGSEAPPASDAQATPLPEVMTDEDMQSLSEDRQEAIDQDSPLGEEHDAVGDLQKRFDP